MTKHAAELEKDSAQRDDVALDRAPRAAGGSALTSKVEEEEALSKIESILAGHGNEAQLPALFALLLDTKRAAFRKKAKLDTLKAVSGDIALQCIEVLGDVSGNEALRIAVNAHPAATPEGLRVVLANRSGEDLATITGDTFKKLKDALPGKLLSHVPGFTEKLIDMDNHPDFLRWFVETTEPGVAAHAFSTALSTNMVPTLDKAKLWTPWVDHLRPSDVTPNVITASTYTTDPTAQPRLATLVGSRKDLDEDKRLADQKAHAGDVHAELAGKPSVAGLLAALDRAGHVDAKDVAPLIATLDRLHASADDVLAVSNVIGIDPAAVLTLLLHSTGVTSQHVSTFLVQRGKNFDLLANATTRKAVRAKAPELQLQDVLAVFNADPKHATVVTTDGLNTWFLENATAADLLWFCGTSPALAAQATRLVGAKRGGFEWVHELTSKEKGHDAQLRVLARNCHDTAAEKYIREVLLGETSASENTSTKTAKTPSDDSRVGEGGRMLAALEQAKDTETSHDLELVERLRDLPEAKRTSLGKDDAATVSIGSRLAPHLFYKAARLLDLNVARAISASPGFHPFTAAYIDARPHAEQLAALAQPGLVKLSAERVHKNLLATFSALQDPSVLAGLLARDQTVLGLLLEGCDPDLVVELISRGPALVEARKVLEKYPILAKHLPRFKHMTDEGKAGIDRIGKDAPNDSQVGYAVEDIKANEQKPTDAARQRGERLHGASHGKTLVQAIEALGTKHEKVQEEIDNRGRGDKLRHAETDTEQELSEVSVLSVLRQHKAELPELLDDKTQRPVVDKIAALVRLPPHMAIPWIDRAQLVEMANAQHWWMTYADSSLFLRELNTANAHARLEVMARIAAGSAVPLAWLEKLPQGIELDEAGQQSLDKLRPLARSPQVLHTLFHKRFGISVPDGYDISTTNQLWSLVARLPPGHIQQKRIEKFTNPDLGGDASGQWVESSSDIQIDDDVTPGSGEDEFYGESMQSWHTAAELHSLYGYDDARIAALVADQRIAERDEKGVKQYRLTKQPIDLFTQVVLHEIGHSVDEVLGKRTSPVFDFAGWHEYTDGTFDSWAAEMGGWEHVRAGDKKQIREAWIDAARGKTTVQAIVGPDHPALSKDYEKAGVNIVKSARAGKKFEYTERIQHGDRIFVAGSYADNWSSVKATTAASAPSPYALYAPAEYFAESYVEYYRGVDGKPGSQQRKGGALPGPVKQWFDANVDTVKFDPRRFKPST